MQIKNRIIAHKKVKASDLAPHPLNFRTHPEHQRQALQDLLSSIGLARSVLAYVADNDKTTNPDRLTLIDGHLRQSMDPDTLLEVEVLDITDDEAHKLLLSIDPLASLAETDSKALEDLRALTCTDSDALANLWASIDQAAEQTQQSINSAKATSKLTPKADVPNLFQVVIDCKTEQDQVALFRRLRREGHQCAMKTH